MSILNSLLIIWTTTNWTILLWFDCWLHWGVTDKRECLSDCGLKGQELLNENLIWKRKKADVSEARNNPISFQFFGFWVIAYCYKSGTETYVDLLTAPEQTLDAKMCHNVGNRIRSPQANSWNLREAAEVYAPNLNISHFSVMV